MSKHTFPLTQFGSGFGTPVPSPFPGINPASNPPGRIPVVETGQGPTVGITKFPSDANNGTALMKGLAKMKLTSNT